MEPGGEVKAPSGPRGRWSLGKKNVKELFDSLVQEGGDGPRTVPVLHALGELCRQTEFAEELGYLGGHQCVRKLMECDVDEVREAAAEVAGTIMSTGCEFPMKPSVAGESSSVTYPTRYDFGGHREVGGPTVLIRSVNGRRQRSQFDVGFQIWPAAIILSRWLCDIRRNLAGHSVLEVGSGLGLCGLVAASFARRVTLSDFNPAVLQALQGNADLNTTRAAVDVMHLDWDHLPDSGHSGGGGGGGGGENGRDASGDEETATMTPSWRADIDADVDACGGGLYDVVIASDTICQRTDCDSMARVLRRFLRPGGEAYFVVGHARTRWGMEFLDATLREGGFSFACNEVADLALLRGIEEAQVQEWLQYRVWHTASDAALYTVG